MNAKTLLTALAMMPLSAFSAAASMTEVFVQVGESVGQGFLAPRGTECFVVTANHLFENESPGSITIIGQRGARSSGFLEKSYPDDLAVIRVESKENLCTGASWPDSRGLDDYLEHAIGKRGTFRSRSEDGGVHQLEVELTYIGDRSLRVALSRQESSFRRGLSGSVLYVGERPVGILLTVPAEGSKEGQVFRLDRVVEILSSYLRPAPALDPEMKRTLFAAVSNAEAVEIEAMLSLDTSRLPSVLTGSALKETTEEIEQLREKKISVMTTPSGLELQEVALDPDGVHAQVKVYIKSSGMTFSSQETCFRLPASEGSATVFLEKGRGGWLVSETQRHFPVPMPEACEDESTDGEEPPEETGPGAPAAPAPSGVLLEIQQTGFVPHVGGWNGGPGLTFRVSGIIRIPRPGTLQVRVLFLFPDGRILFPHAQEVTYRDPENRLATGSAQYRVQAGTIDLGNLPIYPMPAYCLNLVPTGFTMNYQIVAGAQIYLDQTVIAESEPTGFTIPW